MSRISLILVGFLLVACAPAAQGSVDEVGTWDVEGDGVTAVVTYSEDGRYNISPVVDNVALPAFDLGTYVIEAGTIVYTSSAAAVGCEEGDVGRYEIATSGESWTLNLLEDQCAKRSEGGPFVHTPEE